MHSPRFEDNSPVAPLTPPVQNYTPSHLQSVAGSRHTQQTNLLTFLETPASSSDTQFTASTSAELEVVSSDIDLPVLEMLLTGDARQDMLDESRCGKSGG